MRVSRSWIAIALGAVATMGGAVAAVAQDSKTAPSAPEKSEMGGTLKFETIRLSTEAISTALRYGALKKGSERIQLGGRTLVRGKDYAIDYAAGTIMLMTPFKDGDSLSVRYRCEEKSGKKGTFKPEGSDSSSPQSFTFNLTGQGETQAVLGYGITERTGDGNAITSNLYGVKNNFNVGGGGTLRGGIFFNERSKSQSMDMLGKEGQGKDIETGSGRALIQSLNMNVGGGTVSAYYQDIDERFAGMNALRGAGYSDDDVARMARERGMKRTSFSLNDVGVGNVKVSHGFTEVGDAGASITERSSALKAGGLELSYNSVEVDKDFARAKDYSPKDWKQLQKERGLQREYLSGAFSFNGGKATFNQKGVSGDGSGLERQEIGIESSIFNAGWYSQSVDDDFRRFGDLRKSDWNSKVISREAGLRRNGFRFSTDRLGSLSYDSHTVSSDDGKLFALDTSLALGGWTFEHNRFTVDSEFDRLRSLSADAGGHASRIANMVNPGGKAHKNDSRDFFNSAGIDRSSWSARGEAFGAKIGYQNLSIEGEDDGASVEQINISSPNVSLNLRDQKVGEGFEEVGRLTHTERSAIGNRAGMDKQDMSLSAKLGGSRELSVGTMNAEDGTGGAHRESLSYRDKGFKFDYARRGVDQDFEGIRSLVDPERKLLMGMAGIESSEANLRWQMFKGFDLNAQHLTTENALQELDGNLFSGTINWALDGDTQIQAHHYSHQNSSLTDDLIDRERLMFRISRTFGNLGTLSYSEDERTYDGTEDKALDSETKTVAYENQLTKEFGVRTEQSETVYENGERETTSSNTLSAAITENAGLSVTDTQIRRDGDNPNETHRNYGFWYDFGKGIRLKYGYVRDMKGENGKLKNGVEISGGEVGDVKLDGGSYQQNSVDGQSDHYKGKLSLSSARPLDWGWITNVQFNASSDTDIRDTQQRDLWKNSGRSFGFSAMRGDVAFGYDYKSHFTQDGSRAIDRFFHLKTSDKGQFQADLKYGVRTMPDDDDVMIRDYTFSYNPTNRWSLQHNVSTNALKGHKNVLLGSVATPVRTNSWKLDYRNDPRFGAGLFWKETIDEQKDYMTREGGVSLRMFADNPSPVDVWYSLAQTDRAGDRRTAHKWGLSYTQRPGPNQAMSLFFENINWQDGRPSGVDLQNWSMRLDYSLRF